MATVQFNETCGLRGDGWTWFVLMDDGHPFACCHAECKTFEEAVRDFRDNGLEWYTEALAIERRLHEIRAQAVNAERSE